MYITYSQKGKKKVMCVRMCICVSCIYIYTHVRACIYVCVSIRERLRVCRTSATATCTYQRFARVVLTHEHVSERANLANQINLGEVYEDVLRTTPNSCNSSVHLKLFPNKVLYIFFGQF